MPPRDDQDYETRRQQIMDAALEVFSRYGFERATNKQIAAAAKIKSPGLIYHYFKDKADLFRQVLEQRSPALQLITQGDDYMDRPPREVLQRFALSFLQTLEHPAAVASFRLVLGEAIHKPTVAGMFNKLGPERAFRFFARYLEHQMDLGRLRRMDPGAAARCFIGPLVVYVLTREVFTQADSASLRPSVMAETLVDVYLSGMEPTTEGESGAPDSPRAGEV